MNKFVLFLHFSVSVDSFQLDIRIFLGVWEGR